MINPILATSARQRMRSWRTPIIITLYSLFQLGFVWFYSYEAFGKATFTLDLLSRSVEGYIILVIIQFVLLVLVAPAMTAGSIAGERERQTLDLLRVTNTSSLSLVLGKLFESFGFLCLLIVSSIPMLGMILITGAVTLSQMLFAVLFLIVVAFAALSVGLFSSALFRRTVTSTVVAYLSIFGIAALTLVPIFMDVAAIGDIYTSKFMSGAVPQESIDYLPISFISNPGLGLLSLIMDQTDLLQKYLGQFSHTLGVTSRFLDFGKFVWYNLGVMTFLSIILVALATLRLRYRKVDRPRNRRRKG